MTGTASGPITASLTSLIALVAALGITMAPRRADAQELPQPAVVNTSSEFQLGLPEDLPPEPENPYRSSIGIDLGIFVDVLDLSDLELSFDGAEIQAINGLSFDSSPFQTTTSGGVSFGLGGRLWQIFRFPEFRLTIGGASFEDMESLRLGRRDSGFSVQPQSLFFCRIELATGLQYRIGPVTPYALVRGSYASYSFDLSIRHDQLGELGFESASGHAWEVATDVGVSVDVIDHLELGLAWRHTWIGVPSDGVMLTLTASSF